MIALLIALLWPAVIAGALFVVYRLTARALDERKVAMEHRADLDGIRATLISNADLVESKIDALRAHIKDIEDRVRTDSSFRALTPKRR